MGPLSFLVVRFLLIINPAAGRHRAGERGAELLQRLERAGHVCTVEETLGPGHATVLAASGARSHDAVVAIGGDGTLHEVLSGLVQPGAEQLAPLGLVPAGSGDSLAMDLGIADVAGAALRLLAGELRTIDLARVDFFEDLGDAAPTQTRYAANVLAWGAGARINRRAEGMRWAGAQRYIVASIVELIQMGRGTCAAKIDGQVFADDLLGVASLTRFSGRGLQLAPRAQLSDGYIDLVQIKRMSRLQLARIFSAVFRGAHLSHKGVEWRHAQSLTLELGPTGELVVDGELLTCSAARITVERDRLQIFS